jgi:hypothetical protein
LCRCVAGLAPASIFPVLNPEVTSLAADSIQLQNVFDQYRVGFRSLLVEEELGPLNFTILAPSTYWFWKILSSRV